MGKIFTNPITKEQYEEAERKRQTAEETARRDETDLINAAIFEELAALREAINNDSH